MRTSCLSCSATYDFPVSVLGPGEELFVRCKACDAVMTVSKKLAETMQKENALSSASSSAKQDPTRPDLPTLVRRVPTQERPWFASLNGVQHGPYSTQELNEMAMKDVVSASTYLWKAGYSEWKRAHQTGEFDVWTQTAMRRQRTRALEKRVEQFAQAGVTEFSLTDSALQNLLVPSVNLPSAPMPSDALAGREESNKQRVVVPPTTSTPSRAMPFAFGMLLCVFVLTLVLYTIPAMFL